KRCVAIPGDKLEINKGVVYINGKELILPERAKPQFGFNIKMKEPITKEFVDQYDLTEFNLGIQLKNELWNDKALKDFIQKEELTIIELFKDSTEVSVIGQVSILKEKLNISDSFLFFQANLTQEKADALKNDSRVAVVERYLKTGAEDGIFPDYKDGHPSTTRNWNSDNLGPIYMPEAGKSVALNMENLSLYKIIITEYEGNTLKVVGDDIYINDIKTNNYTFKQNYYWMMGDNRNNSLDARYFGFTPEDHIVGTPVFIWMSWDSSASGMDKIRWDRLFTTVSGEGQPQSYFKYFLGLLALYFVGEYFWKKKKAN
ncbi:MAG: S26 family signal peptidase, partial [Bacteroidota bacterium]